MSVVAHFFMSVGGSEIHERLAHFFIDFYKRENNKNGLADFQKSTRPFLHPPELPHLQTTGNRRESKTNQFSELVIKLLSNGREKPRKSSITKTFGL